MLPTAAKVVWILLPYGIGNYVDICFGAVGYCCNIYLLISGKVECDLWRANMQLYRERCGAESNKI